uniref:Uncharacterized protein n=1 Tax=Microbacterium phage Judebell TaxID=3230835 RepID=A0AAU8EG57_9CAUD
MRIHTTIANVNDIYDALRGQQALGRIAKHVSFKTLNEHRSSVMPHAYEIQLEAEVRDCGRRAGNSGSYGAMRPESDGYAATYDEWGWLLRSLFLLDPNMIVGSVKSPVYANAVAFHRKTAWTYAPELLIDALENGDDPFPYITGRAAKTKRGYFLGRRGADRHAVEPFWPHVERPRTVDEVRAFAYPLEVTA